MAKREIIEGKIQGNERGYGFLIASDGRSEDYFIPHGDLRGAMHGDLVLAETTDGTGARTTARVLKVLERGVTEIVGTYFSHRGNGFVCPDDKKYFCDVYIPSGKGLRAKSGEKVVCKILTYPKRQNPEGIVTKILGRQFCKDAEIKSIIFIYKLPEKFPRQVIDEANSVKEPTEKDFEKRSDFRNILTFTIDGEDAKDFDDAVSIEKLSDGKYKLGVHIADVSHYVKTGGQIDLEAFNRATSVYFPETVIPMLPEKLCNDLCSLKQGVDRLTLSCIMVVDKNGNVVDYEITPSVIRSSARTTYTEVQKILDGDKKTAKKFIELVDAIKDMNDLADILIKKRDKEGSIDLDVKESAITVNKGKIEVTPASRDKAHRIIEEFMILANVTVAEYVFFLEKPFIYRIHEKPNPDKLENFYTFLKGLGINFKRKKDEVFSKDFQTILKNAQDTPAFTVVNRVMLRSMQKAKYSPDDVGHFGLSKEHYCHFTSPIRRYPDLVVHRILKDFLSGKDVDKLYAESVYSSSKQSSEKERNAIEAERAVDDYYKLLYIEDYVGEEFEGVISGVTGFGIFVELYNGIEGLVKLETMKIRGKRFDYDDKNYTLSDGKRSFRLGQTVKIIVAGVDITNKRAEFVLC